VSTLTAIDVLLKPDEAARRRARALNVLLLADLPPGGFALDETHVSHVTVLQSYVRADHLERVFAAVEGALAAQDIAAPRLHAVGLSSAEFGTPAGTLVASIEIEPTPALTRFHEAIVAAVAPFTQSGGTAAAFFTIADEPDVNSTTIAYVEEFLPAHGGDRYSPHMTVGVGKEEVVRALAAGRFADFELCPGAVGIYQLGDLGAARRVLRSWPLRRAVRRP
jgi:hypothetical protein